MAAILLGLAAWLPAGAASALPLAPSTPSLPVRAPISQPLALSRAAAGAAASSTLTAPRPSIPSMAPIAPPSAPTLRAPVAAPSGATATAASPRPEGRAGRVSEAPAIAQVDGAKQIYAVSDVHGGYGRLFHLLKNNGLIDGSKARPDAAVWTGGKAVLVVNGDLVDKGKHPVEVIDLVRQIQKSAESQGGRVIVTMGNHEAEFLANPENKKAMSTGPQAHGFSQVLLSRGIDPHAVANGTDAEGRGAWLRNLSTGARVGGWFFVHAGNTEGRSLTDLDHHLRSAIAREGFGSKALVGKNSILEARGWYGKDPEKDGVARADASQLGVKHIVIGHDPNAFGAAPKRIATTDHGALVKIDTGMGKGAKGHLLHIDTSGKKDAVESLDRHGNSTSIK